MREAHRFLRGMVTWAGYPHCAVKYNRNPRVNGKTKYPIHKMLLFAWTAATSFSTLPLRVSILLGFVVGLLGIEEASRALLASFFGWYVVPGWTSLTVVTCVIGSFSAGQHRNSRTICGPYLRGGEKETAVPNLSYIQST